MAGCRRNGPNHEDPKARQRDLRDIELEELRRQVQQLEQRLARDKYREHDVDGHDSDDGSTNNDEDFNPFHDDNDSNDRAYVASYLECKGFGHFAADCPNRRIITLVEEEYEEENEDTTPIYDESDEEEDITYEDHGEALVIRRSLNTTYVPNDSWLRNNIFHTRCTSNDKVCDVIVDGGSCENVVATTMVEKLQLKTKDHPRPYKLSWLQKGNEVKEKNNNLLSKSQFKDVMNESLEAFVLVLLEENKEGNIIPLQVQPLLQEFVDVVPEEIPSGRPPETMMSQPRSMFPIFYHTLMMILRV